MAEITEAKVYEALGLGAKAQEPAAPATTQDTSSGTAPGSAGEGAKAQEPANPAEHGTDNSQSTQTDPTAVRADPEVPEQNAAEGAEGVQAQTIEQRRANAARRREQEQQAAINTAVNEALAKAKQENDANMQTFFAQLGLKNSQTGEAITNIDQFNAWQESVNKANREKALREGKFTPDMLDEMTANHPAVKQAAAMVQQNEQAQKAQHDAQFRAEVDRQLAEIGKLDPTIKEVKDLLSMPDSKEFMDIVNRTNCTYLEAFKLLRMDKVDASKTEAARQQALNMARSKEHMVPAGNPVGTGAVAVPDSQMQMYRLFNPNATAEQIQQHYNKQLKK